MTAEPEEARAFSAAFNRFLTWVQTEDHADQTNPVVRLVRDHLDADGRDQSVVARSLPPFEQVNLQVAIDAWAAQPGRSVDVHGFSVPPHFGGLNLQQLLTGDGLPPLSPSAPELIDLPCAPNRTLACLRRAVLLVQDERGRYVLLIRAPEEHHEPLINLEVAGLATSDAQAVLDDLARLRLKLNVYRGQVVELVPGQRGGLELVFAELPPTARADVVLPEPVLLRIERHTVGIAQHRQALLGAGQHLKRGLLLFGPPGTGKTHTTRYVIGAMSGATVLMLSGRALHMIGAVTQMARDLQPSVLVLEDVDLVAEDRGFDPDANPVLFELLDAMDGAATDADLLFLLTTNRADVLERALAARPGRVDVAVEIGLPDTAARRRLFDLYSADVAMAVSAANVDRAVERTHGVTASFIKELIRRAVLEALTRDAIVAPVVNGADLDRALDDLLDSAQSVTRVLLGVTSDRSDRQ